MLGSLRVRVLRKAFWRLNLVRCIRCRTFLENQVTCWDKLCDYLLNGVLRVLSLSRFAFVVVRRRFAVTSRQRSISSGVLRVVLGTGLVPGRFSAAWFLKKS